MHQQPPPVPPVMPSHYTAQTTNQTFAVSTDPTFPSCNCAQNLTANAWPVAVHEQPDSYSRFRVHLPFTVVPPCPDNTTEALQQRIMRIDANGSSAGYHVANISSPSMSWLPIWRASTMYRAQRSASFSVNGVPIEDPAGASIGETHFTATLLPTSKSHTHARWSTATNPFPESIPYVHT